MSRCQDIYVLRHFFMHIIMQTLLTELFWRLYADVRVIQNPTTDSNSSTMTISNPLPRRVQIFGGWEKQTKPTLNENVGDCRSRLKIKRSKNEETFRCDIACWEFVDNDWYSTRSVYTHKTDGNETMINTYPRGGCDVMQCWHDK